MDKRAKGEKGFTLIELLVVIIIIGILAAIAIPAFLNQRQKAWASQVQSDVKNAAIAAESYAVGNNGSYLNLDGAALTANGFHSTKDVTVTVSGVSADDYTLTGKNANLPSTRTFVYTSKTGVIVDSTAPTP
jgi:type IV pilus assembly protein PilA